MVRHDTGNLGSADLTLSSTRTRSCCGDDFGEILIDSHSISARDDGERDCHVPRPSCNDSDQLFALFHPSTSIKLTSRACSSPFSSCLNVMYADSWPDNDDGPSPPLAFPGPNICTNFQMFLTNACSVSFVMLYDRYRSLLVDSLWTKCGIRGRLRKYDVAHRLG